MKDNKLKFYVFFPIIIATFFALGIGIGHYYTTLGNLPIGNKTASKNKINKLIDFIDAEYVDNINTDSIVDLTVNGILKNLDPHSTYIPKGEQAKVSEEMEGNFVGIGVNFYMYKDTLTVIKPVENGPSAKAGILPGDRILFANKTQLFNKKLSSESLFPILKGKIGSTVSLEIYRKSENKKFKVQITRGNVPLKSVEIATLVKPGYGYIKINRFAEKTAIEFHNGLKKIIQQGAKNVIIDLRDNGGGYMEMAIEIADEFLKNKELIIKTKNKKGAVEKTYATNKGLFENGKVLVLINENSASASEILAGAIQDNDRGLIIGRRSFGKGLVQKEITMQDGSAVRLTVARYYTPSGRSIQKPYEDKGEKYFNEFEKRFKSGELYEKDSIKVADSLKFKTKNGRIVYGGGGITPDVFVPISIKNHSEQMTQLLETDFLSYHVLEQLDLNRAKLKLLSIDALKTEIFKNPIYFKNLKKYFVGNGLLMNLDNHKSELLTYLYAEYVKQLFNEEAYFKITLLKDKMIEKALIKY